MYNQELFEILSICLNCCSSIHLNNVWILNATLSACQHMEEEALSCFLNLPTIHSSWTISTQTKIDVLSSLCLRSSIHPPIQTLFHRVHSCIPTSGTDEVTRRRTKWPRNAAKSGNLNSFQWLHSVLQIEHDIHQSFLLACNAQNSALIQYIADDLILPTNQPLFGKREIQQLFAPGMEFVLTTYLVPSKCDLDDLVESFYNSCALGFMFGVEFLLERVSIEREWLELGFKTAIDNREFAVAKYIWEQCNLFFSNKKQLIQKAIKHGFHRPSPTVSETKEEEKEAEEQEKEAEDEEKEEEEDEETYFLQQCRNGNGWVVLWKIERVRPSSYMRSAIFGFLVEYEQFEMCQWIIQKQLVEESELLDHVITLLRHGRVVTAARLIQNVSNAMEQLMSFADECSFSSLLKGCQHTLKYFQKYFPNYKVSTSVPVQPTLLLVYELRQKSEVFQITAVNQLLYLVPEVNIDQLVVRACARGLDRVVECCLLHDPTLFRRQQQLMYAAAASNLFVVDCLRKHDPIVWKLGKTDFKILANRITTTTTKEEECPVCMENKCVVSTDCNHLFCAECLTQVWIKLQSKCPICRHSVTTVQILL